MEMHLVDPSSQTILTPHSTSWIFLLDTLRPIEYLGSTWRVVYYHYILVSYVYKIEFKLLFTCVTEKDPVNVMCYAYGYYIDGCNVYMMFEIK